MNVFSYHPFIFNIIMFWGLGSICACDCARYEVWWGGGRAISPDSCHEIFMVVSETFCEAVPPPWHISLQFVCSSKGFRETWRLAYYLQHTHTHTHTKRSMNANIDEWLTTPSGKLNALILRVKGQKLYCSMKTAYMLASRPPPYV